MPNWPTADELADALESNEYEKGKSRLWSSDGQLTLYCCLGVCATMADIPMVDDYEAQLDIAFIFDVEEEEPLWMEYVAEAAKLVGVHPFATEADKELINPRMFSQTILAKLNDSSDDWVDVVKVLRKVGELERASS